MHSFTPSLSFLISILLVPLLRLSLQSTSSGPVLSFARAAELQNPHSNLTSSTSKDLVGHSNSLPSLRRHAIFGHNPSIRRADFNLHLGRRASNARFTYYVTGLGACGTFNKASDFVVALNVQQWENGKHCNAPITITINGKTAHAQIVDRCLGCGYNNLDFTSGLYSFFDPSLNGVLQGDWEYGSGTTPTTTSKATTTSHWTTSTTTTLLNTATSSASVTSSASLPSNTTTAAVASPSDGINNLEQMVLAMVGMGGILLGTLDSVSH